MTACLDTTVVGQRFQPVFPAEIQGNDSVMGNRSAQTGWKRCPTKIRIL